MLFHTCFWNDIELNIVVIGCLNKTTSNTYLNMSCVFRCLAQYLLSYILSGIGSVMSPGGLRVTGADTC